MYSFDDIRVVHLEVTSKCNASCPMCLRNVLGGKTNPHLPLTELSLEDIQRILPVDLVQRLNRVYLCGNYGDPMMATDTDRILAYLRDHNAKMNLSMFTNGSGRSEEWWQALARNRVTVRFGVDGLEEINAIYRRGTKWPLILRNMKTFLAAGGSAEWDFIVFKHNEHQVEEARSLAAELGFKKFTVKKTARFFSNTKGTVKDKHEVHNRDGEIEYYLEMPTPQNMNSALKKEDSIKAQFGSIKEFAAQADIDCKAIQEASIYISAEGLAFPCCWTANDLYPWYAPKEGMPIWKKIRRLPGGLKSLDAKIHPLRQIVEGPFFQNSLPESWKAKTYEDGRLFSCGKICGKGFDSFKAQFEANAPSQGRSVQNP